MIQRRDFIKKIPAFSFLTFLSTSFIASCAKRSDETPAATTSGSCNTNGATGAVSNTGHTHPTIAVPSADVITATQKTYNLLVGSTGHVHTVTVAAANFTTLQSNTSIVLTTDADGTGHSHSVTITCS